MTDWIFQGNGKQHDLDAAIAASRLHSWRTPRYRDLTAAGDRVWLQIAGRNEPGIYYVATIVAPTYEDPEWHEGGSAYARWRTDVRFDYRIDPPLLRVELQLRSGRRLSSVPAGSSCTDRARGWPHPSRCSSSTRTASCPLARTSEANAKARLTSREARGLVTQCPQRPPTWAVTEDRICGKQLRLAVHHMSASSAARRPYTSLLTHQFTRV